jgi:hypothetical protein
MTGIRDERFRNVGARPAGDHGLVFVIVFNLAGAVF